jgi:hypothetical protein
MLASFSKKSAFPSRGGQHRHAEAAFVAKLKALAPKYRTEFFPLRLELAAMISGGIDQLPALRDAIDESLELVTGHSANFVSEHLFN